MLGYIRQTQPLRWIEGQHALDQVLEVRGEEVSGLTLPMRLPEPRSLLGR